MIVFLKSIVSQLIHILTFDQFILYIVCLYLPTTYTLSEYIYSISTRKIQQAANMKNHSSWQYENILTTTNTNNYSSPREMCKVPLLPTEIVAGLLSRTLLLPFMLQLNTEYSAVPENIFQVIKESFFFPSFSHEVFCHNLAI